MADEGILGIGRGLRGSKRRILSIDGEPWRSVSSDLLRAAGVRDGARVTRDELEHRLEESEPRVARERALRLLSVRERTEAELRGRLLDDGYPEAVAEAVVMALSDTGLVDDSRYAASVARSLIEIRRLGRSRALRELAHRGLPEQLARDAVDALAPPADEGPRARDVAARLARPSDSVPRLASRLVRRGFAPGDALSAARAVLAGREDEEGDLEP